VPNNTASRWRKSARVLLTATARWTGPTYTALPRQYDMVASAVSCSFHRKSGVRRNKHCGTKDNHQRYLLTSSRFYICGRRKSVIMRIVSSASMCVHSEMHAAVFNVFTCMQDIVDWLFKPREVERLTSGSGSSCELLAIMTTYLGGSAAGV
jgi:hypothetical protein